MKNVFFFKGWGNGSAGGTLHQIEVDNLEEKRIRDEPKRQMIVSKNPVGLSTGKVRLILLYIIKKKNSKEFIYF